MTEDSIAIQDLYERVLQFLYRYNSSTEEMRGMFKKLLLDEFGQSFLDSVILEIRRLFNDRLIEVELDPDGPAFNYRMTEAGVKSVQAIQISKKSKDEE